jgi:acetyl/propionyl-CoA carboxylase alpha subunit
MSTEQSVSTNSAGASLAPRAGASMPEVRAEGKAQRKEAAATSACDRLGHHGGRRRRGLVLVAAAAECVASIHRGSQRPPRSGQVEIASKYSGRIAVVLAKEGDMVHAGQVLARMDTAELEAQLQAAKAQVKKAEQEKIMAEASAWRVSDQRRPSWRPSQGAQRRDCNPASLTESRNKHQ